MPIRLRLALAFGAAAAVLVALGGWVFVTVLSSSMLGSIDAQLKTAAGVAGRYVTPGVTGVSRSGQLPGEYLLQVLDASGRVTASGPDAGGAPLITGATLRRAAAGQVVETTLVDGEATRIVAEPYGGHSGSLVVAGISLESYDHSVGTLQTGVVLGGAAVLVVAAAGSYLLARRALAPVERMRRQVQALSSTEEAAGIPVPATRDELATLARTMNELLARLHASLERQRGFVADASHELRSPLAVLRGELELAGRPDRSKEQLTAAVASAAEEAARLTRLTEDLLLLARSDSASLALRPQRVQVTALLDQVARANARRAGEAGVRFVVSSPRDLAAIVDGHRVRQAVDDLVDNALRFAPRCTAVELRGSGDAGSVTVEVLDRGPGFPAEFLPHAFERFSRPAGERSRQDGGAGLGLAIVAAIAAAHGGAATARNRDHGGAAVRLTVAADASVPPEARGSVPRGDPAVARVPLRPGPMEDAAHRQT